MDGIPPFLPSDPRHPPRADAQGEQAPFNPYAPPASAILELEASRDEVDRRWAERGFRALFGHSFRILAIAFGPLMGAYLVIWAPLNFLLGYFGTRLPAVEMFGELIAEGFIGILATGTVLGICESVWWGRHPDIGAALGLGAATWGRLWVGRFLTGLLAILALLALVLPVIWVSVRLVLVDAVIVTEGASGAKGVQRSWDLTRGRFWSLFAALIPPGVVTIVSTMAVAMLTEVPGWDQWWISAALYCALAPVLVFFIVFGFVIYKHLAADPAAS